MNPINVYSMGYETLDAIKITGTNLLYRLGLSDIPATNLEGYLADSPKELQQAFAETAMLALSGSIGKTIKTGKRFIKFLKRLFKPNINVSNIVCFVAGTAVLTNYGLTNIENIKTGDSVWTYNIEDGTSEIAVVTNNFVRNSQNFVKLHLGADTIVSTEEHPFFENDGWVAAKDLKQGDSLFAFSGAKLKIDSLFQFRTDTATTVYNLEVAGNNDYYVSASKVLVHNCDGVYDLGTSLGRYVGQSNNIPRRILQHFSKGGKLFNTELKDAVFHSMPGSTKLEREVYEQYLIDKVGIKHLINARNPMGGRRELYDKMIENVINKYNLPK